MLFKELYDVVDWNSIIWIRREGEKRERRREGGSKGWGGIGCE